jgi:hypothetical protein
MPIRDFLSRALESISINENHLNSREDPFWIQRILLSKNDR